MYRHRQQFYFLTMGEIIKPLVFYIRIYYILLLENKEKSPLNSIIKMTNPEMTLKKIKLHCIATIAGTLG